MFEFEHEIEKIRDYFRNHESKPGEPVVGLASSAPRMKMMVITALLADHASVFEYSEASDRAEVYDLSYPELEQRLKNGWTIVGDCSSTYEANRKDAGCVNLPPLGYTGTELNTMPHITLAEALQGDAIVFGVWPGLHVVWITKPDPHNPSVAGHGAPGFTEDTLQELWISVFAGHPITVLSLAPFLPEAPAPPTPADPHHYQWFMPDERELVEKYDELRLDLAKNETQILEVIEKLIPLRDRLETVVKHDGWGSPDLHRAWRVGQLKERCDQKQVVK